MIVQADLVLSSTLVALIHVDVKVSGVFAFVRRMRRGLVVPRLLRNHHFDAIAADHLTVQQVDRLASGLAAGVLHVAKLTACST